MKTFVLFLALFLAAGCSKQNSENLAQDSELAGLRPLNTNEALEDFDEMANLFKNYYGPLEFKERRFGFDFDEIVAKYRKEIEEKDGAADAEYFEIYSRFIAEFKDGHVGISYPLNNEGVRDYYIPLFVFPIEGKVAVWAVGKELSTATDIKRGHIVVEVDGEPIENYFAKIKKYQTIGQDESDRHWIFRTFIRSHQMTDLKPKKNTVRVVFEMKGGKRYSEELVWQRRATDGFASDLALDNSAPQFTSMSTQSLLNEKATLFEMAQSKPFFATKEVTKKYSWRVVEADEQHRKKYGLKEGENPDIFAALYRFEDKNVLLVRNYRYMHQDLSNEKYMAGYRAILDQWEEFADVLVLDQTHNGGGSYCEDFYSLFIEKESNAMVQFMNTDRRWIKNLRIDYPKWIEQNGGAEWKEIGRRYKAMAFEVEKDYDKGLSISEIPHPLIGSANLRKPDAEYTWKKPMLVLVDELAGSCGDIFPMLMKSNKTAKLFGKRTMGLGGNVQPFQPLQNSLATIRLTRGLFTSYKADGNYTDADLAENNAVIPDYEYNHTLKDFRAGYVNYVKTFTHKALEQIPAE